MRLHGKLSQWAPLAVPVQVKIFNWRIALVIMLLQPGVLIYTALQSIMYWRIIKYEQVQASYNSWSFAGWRVDEATRVTAPHCTSNPNFDLAPLNKADTGSLRAYNHTCPAMGGHEFFRYVAGEAQVMTWSQHIPTSGHCKDVLNGNESHFKECVRSEFVHGAEDVPIFLLSSVSAPGLGISRTFDDLKCSIVNAAGETVGEVNQDRTDGNGWMTSLRELLLLAGGYTLDDTNMGNVIPVRAGTKVRYRTTGFIIVLHFKYWNYEPAPENMRWDPATPRCELRVELQKQSWGYLGLYSRQAEEVQLASAARIMFRGHGEFGTINARLVVTAVVEGVVLMGIVGSIATILARFIIGREALDDATELQAEVIRGEDRKAVVAMKSNHCNWAVLSSEAPVSQAIKDNEEFQARTMSRSSGVESQGSDCAVDVTEVDLDLSLLPKQMDTVAKACGNYLTMVEERALRAESRANRAEEEAQRLEDELKVELVPPPFPIETESTKTLKERALMAEERADRAEEQARRLEYEFMLLRQDVEDRAVRAEQRADRFEEHARRVEIEILLLSRDDEQSREIEIVM